jgi:hypothetical protein
MYKYLTKEEKAELRNSYLKTKRGSNLSYTLNRLVLEGGFLLICTMVIIGAGLFTNEMEWWMWTLAGLTTFCGIVFLTGQYIIRMKEYNKFLKSDYKPGKKKLTKIK